MIEAVYLAGIIASALFLFFWQKRDGKMHLAWAFPWYAGVFLMVFCVSALVGSFIISPAWGNALVVFIAVALSVTLAAVSFTHIQFPDYFVKKDIHEINLKPGVISIIPELKITNSILFFKKMTSERKGLLISRSKPDALKKQFGVSCEMKWLSAEEGADVNPQDLEELSYVINTFLETQKSVVLFEGFTFLVRYHDFMKVFHLFQVLKDRVSKNNGVLIMPVAPSTLDPKEFKMLRGEFEVV